MVKNTCLCIALQKEFPNLYLQPDLYLLNLFHEGTFPRGESSGVFTLKPWRVPLWAIRVIPLLDVAAPYGFTALIAGKNGHWIIDNAF